MIPKSRWSSIAAAQYRRVERWNINEMLDAALLLGDLISHSAARVSVSPLYPERCFLCTLVMPPHVDCPAISWSKARIV